MNYFHTIIVCNFFKTQEGNSYIKLNIGLDEADRESAQQRRDWAKAAEQNGLMEELELSGASGAFVDSDDKADLSESIFTIHVYAKTHFYVCNNKSDPRAMWYYIKTEERLYLPDHYRGYFGMNDESVGVINVSLYSILISQHFINTFLCLFAYLHKFDLQQLDINNPPIACKKIISFAKIINNRALASYDKWVVF